MSIKDLLRPTDVGPRPTTNRTESYAYSTKQLATLMGVSVQRVHAQAKAESWQSHPRAGRGGGKEWLVSSMPPDSSARLAITQATAAANVPAMPGEDAVIPDWANAIGLSRYRLVHELRQAVKRNPKKRKLDVLEGFLSAYHSGLLLPELRERLGDVSMQTLYR
ncbi:DNA-binding protein, partial [Desulfocurvibacter africanus]|uniref:DNA-binding protein n=1 Tax=Desulfocurvibacter africanus TaxID=873 RepID=UPI002FDB2B4D